MSVKAYIKVTRGYLIYRLVDWWTNSWDVKERGKEILKEAFETLSNDKLLELCDAACIGIEPDEKSIEVEG